jgi:hypothetical protein
MVYLKQSNTNSKLQAARPIERLPIYDSASDLQGTLDAMTSCYGSVNACKRMVCPVANRPVRMTWP